MAVRDIVCHPNDILEKECKPVAEFNNELHRLLDDMFETMYEAEGVGLAAPQIGIGQQIAVVDIGDDNGQIEMINPTITEREGEQTGIEGCLSFPGLFGDVTRAQKVTVKAQNRFGEEFILKAEGFLARALQHEIDHLGGILFTTKVTKFYTEEELERER
ncbi:peptide deformylase [Fictibacillus sp. Mic-4]|uniref:peptide deformylase n=1 Tax=Fictibacillus TaxID=1329200 RepID=UPI0003F9866F|nr:peptide deformylase [Fictibacillus gelatini]